MAEGAAFKLTSRVRAIPLMVSSEARDAAGVEAVRQMAFHAFHVLVG